MIWIVLQLAFVAVGASMMRAGRIRPSAASTTPHAKDVMVFHPELFMSWDDEADYAIDYDSSDPTAHGRVA